MKKVLVRLIILAVVVGAAWGGYKLYKKIPQRQQIVATTKVRRGDVVIRAYSRGELRAVRSATLTAPNLFGAVQVTRLAPLGSLAHDKDLIVEFDDSERKAQLEETLLEVDQTDEQIKKSQADLSIRDNQDKVDLLKARYAVRRAELEVKRNELLSAIDAKKNLLNLDEARRHLQQLESDIKSRQEQGQAELAVLREQRNKSMIDVAREKQRIAQAKLLSPMTGLVAVRQNRAGNFFFPGMQLPDIREGDTLQPGMPVADVLDLSELEVVARVGELDRANLHEGQDVSIQLDAVPEKKFRGKIKSMSGTASANIFSGDPAKKFDVVFSIDMKQLLTGLGAKPEDIKRIMETAERNSKKAPASMMPPMMAMGGPGGAPPAPGGGQGAPAGGPQGAAMQVGSGGPAGPPGAQPGAPGAQMTIRMGPGNMSPEQQTKMREAMQKVLGGKNPQDLTPEQRQKAFAQVQQLMAAAPAKPGGPQATSPAAGGVSAGPAGGPPAPGAASKGSGAPGGRPPAMDFMKLASMGSAASGTEEERAKAKLPPPPDEDSQLDVLLRPGLLADVEITVEKIPDAIHVPAQAIFDKDGRSVVYVKSGTRFEQRVVKLAKRSENTMVIANGLKPNEVIALADPNAKSGDKKGEKKSGSSNALPGMSGGGGAGKGGK